MSNADRVIIFRTKANRFEDVEVSHEVYHETPVVSVRRYRGENFTGKGISLRPELLEQLLPEIMKAIKSLRQSFAGEGGADGVERVVTGKAKKGRKKMSRKDAETNELDADEIERQAKAKIMKINADTSLTPQQKKDKLTEVSKWAYKKAEWLIFDN